ncbi:ABC transporter ATP-binding protein [Candidatus Aminicenantes bacterium AC-335-B20]|jgi:phospholipid/cholesterol/gamma-HCH transport system ATP-binding protein|nr:ABC transporter ATP-binding protein [SCandidatus Aminicenantes bacterium Aminicenantia_JdfR_composite]MCP2596682.1 ABC transporter ATP-binding protein [Candidatus Aminicenantes bacterium AC-335-G13]MCP2598926.1 ABC transporter ATP-binding protein [Candidatus Aminicenantes bacterium AC-335-B20]
MIEIIDLHKSINSKKVLKGVNLKVEEGETMVVIGPSGVGKTVLLKHLLGLMKPDKGEIYIKGVEITHLKNEEIRKFVKIGMVFQEGALFDSLTVGENISFGLEKHTDLSPEEIKEIVASCLEKVGLPGIENLLPHELSGGMKKRVSLARAIAYNPEIILYDEPSTGIDPIRADAINELIIKMKNELKVTSVIITHDIRSAFKVGDRVAMLYDGKIIEVGTPEEIKNSSNPVVQQFITGEAKGPIRSW